MKFINISKANLEQLGIEQKAQIYPTGLEISKLSNFFLELSNNKSGKNVDFNNHIFIADKSIVLKEKNEDINLINIGNDNFYLLKNNSKNSIYSFINNKDNSKLFLLSVFGDFYICKSKEILDKMLIDLENNVEITFNIQERKALNWAINKSGLSSRTVAKELFPKIFEFSKELDTEYSIPHDNSDFNRILELQKETNLTDDEIINAMKKIGKEYDYFANHFVEIKSLINEGSKDSKEKSYALIKAVKSNKNKLSN